MIIPGRLSVCAIGAMVKGGFDFYSVYGELFAKLDREEEDEEEMGTVHEPAAPFGDENSSKEEVYGFYRDWERFSSINLSLSS